MSERINFGLIALIVGAGRMFAQAPAARSTFDAFEVATIKPTPPDFTLGRYIRMQSAHQFVAKNATLKYLVAAAFSLNPKAISGGPAWTDTDRYDIVAATPGEARPTLDDQMKMLRGLLADRFKLTFHREQKELSMYAITVAKNGPKLKESTAPPDESPQLISIVYPGAGGGIDHLLLPAKNATMAELASALQRAMLDRPVVDQTGLSGKYDFDLEWTPDETQFDGTLPASAESTQPGFFAAVQQQLGLKFEATKGPVAILIIDKVQRPSEN